MKTKLFKRLRREGRNMVHIYSVTITSNWRGSVVTGMSYSYKSDEYAHLFNFGDTEDDVRDKAARIFMEKEVLRLRQKRTRKRLNIKR